MTEQLTPEQIEAYRQQMALQEQAAMQSCIQALQQLAAEHGFMIVAIPRLTNDGRTVADWGVVRRGRQ